jgi:hypothetical protein
LNTSIETKWSERMKFCSLVLILFLLTGVLAGCGGADSPSADEVSPVEEQGKSAQDLETSVDSMDYAGQALDASYEGALPVSSQLALGTIELEGTENAVTPDQAKALLPLWQAIRGGALQGESETNAVLKQIERAMTAEQLVAIVAMQLTMEDMGAWMQQQGLSMGRAPGVEGGQTPFSNMTEEERTAVRATAQAGGGMSGGGGQFGTMSEEDRQALRATAEASGMTLPAGGGRGGAGRGQLAVLADQVVELLTGRASE